MLNVLTRIKANRAMWHGRAQAVDALVAKGLSPDEAEYQVSRVDDHQVYSGLVEAGALPATQTSTGALFDGHIIAQIEAWMAANPETVALIKQILLAALAVLLPMLGL